MTWEKLTIKQKKGMYFFSKSLQPAITLFSRAQRGFEKNAPVSCVSALALQMHPVWIGSSALCCLRQTHFVTWVALFTACAWFFFALKNLSALSHLLLCDWQFLIFVLMSSWTGLLLCHDGRSLRFWFIEFFLWTFSTLGNSPLTRWTLFLLELCGFGLKSERSEKNGLR